MIKSRLRANVLLPFLGWWLLSCSDTTNKEITQPNIVLIMTDDQGWGDLGLHGNPVLQTPNLDQLGRESTRFTRFYVSPVCAPTRASLLTGRYHLRTGTSWVTHRKEVMRSDEITIAEILKGEGYQTGIFGKWHNGEQFPHNPQGQGFDHFVGFSSGHWNNYFDTELEVDGKFQSTSGYITDALTNAAKSFIRSNQDGPFFAYLPYNAPHSPFQVPNTYFDKYKAKGLSDRLAAVYGMVENVDDNVGEVLSLIDSLGLADNTIVMFLTDNGPNGKRYNGGMKGVKGKVDEGGIRVPFFVRWPGQVKANVEIATISSHIDILPTIADLCQIKLPANIDLDGLSLVPLMKQTNQWPQRNIYTHQVRQNLDKTPGSVRSDQYRLVLRNDSTLLYDMISDPFQKVNLASEYPDIAARLSQDYDTWFSDVSQGVKEKPVIEVGHEGYSTVRLPAHEAGLSGDLLFKGGMGWANDYHVNWTNQSRAEWTIEFIRNARVEVFVSYTNRESSIGAQLSVQMAEQELVQELTDAHDPDLVASPDRVPRGEVYEKEWKRTSLGILEGQKGLNAVSLAVRNNRDPSGVDIKMLELVVHPNI